MGRRGINLLFLVLLAVGAAVAAYVLAPRPQTQQPTQAAAVAAPAASGNRVLVSDAMRAEAERADNGLGAVRSLINVDQPLRYGQYVWDEAGVAPGDLYVRVDLKAQTVSVFRGGHEIGTAVILYGAQDVPTPTGNFPILGKSKDHQSRKYDAPMPYSLWLTSDGVAIHGSNVQWGSATHGCVGVPLDFARRLFDAAKVGDPVRVIA